MSLLKDALKKPLKDANPFKWHTFTQSALGRDNLGKTALPIAGAIVGGYFLGPWGAAAGSALGTQLSGGNSKQTLRNAAIAYAGGSIYKAGQAAYAAYGSAEAAGATSKLATAGKAFGAAMSNNAVGLSGAYNVYTGANQAIAQDKMQQENQKEQFANAVEEQKATQQALNERRLSLEKQKRQFLPSYTRSSQNGRSSNSDKDPNIGAIILG